MQDRLASGSELAVRRRRTRFGESVVGPRPHAVTCNAQYRKLIKGAMLRHKVKPGITGRARVNGLRGETETRQRFHPPRGKIGGWNRWRV
jgi:putative colanic acid biosynthesis UDP-glucose lipid carrier transferase